jgi:glycosyltransferase involved in cell wall biosynthesis
MAPRKLLLLTYFFPPCGAVAVYRMLGLVRYLPRYGWQPIVVAPPHVPYEPDDPALLDLVPPGTEVVRLPLVSGPAAKVVRRVAPMAHWLPRAYRACRRLIRDHRPDAILTSSPPPCIHLLGMALRSRYRLPWAACFRDPWFTNQRAFTPSLRQRWNGWLESQVIRRADAVIANTPLNLSGFQAAYPAEAGKMVTITNGFDPERFPHGAYAPPADGAVTLLHAGELYGGRDPRPLLDALAQLRAEAPGAPPIRVNFLGRADDGRFDLPTEIRTRSLEGAVTAEGHAPYDEAVRRMARADILLLVQWPGHRISVPAKLYEYLGTGRPVLALAEPDGDIAWVLRTSGVLHRVAPTHDVPRIKQALVELAGAVRRGTPAVGDAAALQSFTREQMARRFADCLDGMVQAAPRTARSPSAVTA